MPAPIAIAAGTSWIPAVCSCPTCGYMLKKVILERAYYSKEYQELVGGDERPMKVPEDVLAKGAVEERRFRMLSRSIYCGILKDDGYFSRIDLLKRIMVAEHTYDLGEYLLTLYREGELNAPNGTILGKNAYYPPCHLR